MNIIYLRVSTNEKRQDLDQQFEAILDKYQLEEFALLRDEASAYQIDKVHKRHDFITLLDTLFDVKVTIMDLFLKNRHDSEPIYLYVWDLSRIMRNQELNALFFLLCKNFNVKIVSHKDNKTYNESDFYDPTEKFIELMIWNADSYGAEKYSYDTSINIKRGYDNDAHGSTKGMAWGQGMTPNDNWYKYWSDTVMNNKNEVLDRLTGKGRLRLTISEKESIDRYIKKLLEMGYMRSDVIKMVAERKGIVINAKYLSINFKDIN